MTVAPNADVATLDDFELKVENHLAQTYQGVIGFGTCLPPDISDDAEFHFEDRAGNRYPAARRQLQNSKNGAPSWAYFSFPLSLRRMEFRHFKLKSGPNPEDHPRLQIEKNNGAISIVNGDDQLRFENNSLLGLSSLTRDGAPLLAGESGAGIECDGVVFGLAKPLQLSIHSANDYEIVVQAQGEIEPQDASDEIVAAGNILLRLRYTIQIGRPGFALNVLFSNRRRSDQELLMRRFSLSWAMAAPVEATLLRQLATGNLCLSQEHRIEGAVSIRDGRLEDTSPLEMPQSAELYPFFRRFDRAAFFGRVAPFFALKVPQGALVVSWGRSSHLDANSAHVENCDGHARLTLEPISPGGGERRIPQGFSRSFDFTFTSHTGDLNPQEAVAIYEVADARPLVSVHPRWYIANRAEEMERILPYRPDLHPRFERQLWREFAKGYFNGFYHAGDWVSERGNAQMHAEARDDTWDNNEEDQLKGIAWMLMRTGDPSYGEDLRVCARHLIEVDRCAWSSHPLQNGVLLAHALNHFDGTGYPSHCWIEGLLLYYKLSGDDDALETFFGVCDWHLEWTKTPDRIRFADAREMGVPITNLAHAYLWSGEQKYLDAARLYIARFRRQMDEDGGLWYKYSGFSGRMMLYSEYVAVEGLWDFYEMIGGDDVRELLMEIITWIDRYALDAFGNYDARGTSESMLQPFYIAYKLSGDLKWLEKGRGSLSAAMSQPSGLPLLKFGNNAAFYKEAMDRGWFCDQWVELHPVVNHRAVNRTYPISTFEWEKLAICYSEGVEK